MPEGDTIHRLARRCRVLVDEPLRLRLGPLLREAQPGPVRHVQAVGKNLLLHFEDGRSLRLHLGLGGSAPLRAPGSPLGERPELLLETSRHQLSALQPLHCVLVERPQLQRLLGSLGPDLLGPEPDWAEVVGRARARSAALHLVLLDQRVAAGIGNVYKSELLFFFKRHPEQGLEALEDGEVERLYRKARSWLLENVERPRRRTTGPHHPLDLWVYGRARQPCARCRTRLQGGGHDDRPTVWCPRCQRIRV